MTIIIVTGYIVRGPLGGMTWHYLQYILGLKKLGYEVYFLEKSMNPISCYDPDLNTMGNNCTYGLNYLRQIMTFFQMPHHWIFIDYSGKHYGLAKDNTLNLLKRADALIDVSGTCWLPELSQVPKKILIDTDPAFTQFRFARRINTHKAKTKPTSTGGWGDLTVYDSFFTFGLNIGEPDCPVPTCGIDWQKTRQPILVDLWKPCINPNLDHFTTIMNWRTGSFTYKGEHYGPKNIEFQKFIRLPTLTPQTFRLAVGGSPPRQALHNASWILVGPIGVSRDLWSYQRFIMKSRAEWSVAKNAYVKTKCGWFSERSACYLAAGKPVLVQDTGFSKYLPTGQGLMIFNNLDEILKGIDAINRDYAGHCAAARHLAETHFDSDQVLKDILQKTGI